MDEQEKEDLKRTVEEISGALEKLASGFTAASRSGRSVGTSGALYTQTLSAARRATEELAKATTDEVRKKREANEETRVYARHIGKVVKDYDKLSDAQRAQIKLEALAAEASGKSIERIQEEAAQREKGSRVFKKTLSGVANDLAGFSSGLTLGGNGFSQLNSIIQNTTTAASGIGQSLALLVPVIGDGIAKAIEAGTTIAKKATDIILQTMTQQFDAFRNLTGEGLTSSITELRRTASAAGLRFEDLASVLKNRGSDLAGAFGSAISGAERFANISYEIRDSGLQEQLLNLGLSVKDVNEASVDAIGFFRRTGQLRGRSDAQLARMTAEYIKELDELTKLTGLSRREQQDIQERALSETRYRAFYETLEEGEKRRFMEANKLISATFGKDSTTAAGIRDLLATGGAAVTEASKAVLVGYGSAGEELRRKLQAGSITAAEFTKELVKAGKVQADSVNSIAKIQGDSTIVTKLYTEQVDAAARATENITKEQAEARKRQKDQTAGTDVLTKSMTTAQQQMYEAGSQLQLLASGSEFAASVMENFSDGILAATTLLYEFSGESIPDHLKARKEEREAIQERIKLEKKLNELQSNQAKSKNIYATPQSQKAIIDRTQQKIDEATKKAAEATARRQQADAAYRDNLRQNVPSSAATSSVQVPPSTGLETRESLEQKGLILAPPGRDVQGNNNVVSPRLIELAKQIQENIPGFKYFSGFNDRYHHTLDYASKHKTGMALDFTLTEHPTERQSQQIVQQLKQFGASDVRDEYNNPSRAATGPHFHVQIPEFSFGGIIQGPQTGYTATLHGREAIIPLNNNLKTTDLDLNQVMSEIISRTDDQSVSGINSSERVLEDSKNNREQKLSKIDDLIIKQTADFSNITQYNKEALSSLLRTENILDKNINNQSSFNDVTSSAVASIKTILDKNINNQSSFNDVTASTVASIKTFLNNKEADRSKFTSDMLTNLSDMLQQSAMIPLTNTLETKIMNLTDIISEKNIDNSKANVSSELTAVNDTYSRELSGFMKDVSNKFDEMINRLDTQITNQDKQIRYMQS